MDRDRAQKREQWWRRVNFVLALIHVVVSYRFPGQFANARSQAWYSAYQVFAIVMRILSHRYPWQPGRRYLLAPISLAGTGLLLGWAWWWGRKQRALRHRDR